MVIKRTVLLKHTKYLNDNHNCALPLTPYPPELAKNLLETIYALDERGADLPDEIIDFYDVCYKAEEKEYIDDVSVDEEKRMFDYVVVEPEPTPDIQDLLRDKRRVKTKKMRAGRTRRVNYNYVDAYIDALVDEPDLLNDHAMWFIKARKFYLENVKDRKFVFRIYYTEIIARLHEKGRLNLDKRG